MSTSTFHQTQQNIAQFQARDKLVMVFDQVDFQVVKNDFSLVTFREGNEAWGKKTLSSQH